MPHGNADVLQSIWARTATLIAVTSLVATFLGARALDQSASHKWINYLAILPLAAFGLSLVMCVRVLIPTDRDDEPDDSGDTRVPDAAAEPPADAPDAESRPEPADSQAKPARRELQGLRFTLDANRVLATAAALTPDDEPLKVAAARNLQANWDGNRTLIEAKFGDFKCACWALIAQVVFWGLLLVAKGVM